ncbi:hemicentin-2-like [Ixodes scapularis]
MQQCPQQNYSRRRQQHRPRPDWVGRAFFLGVRQDPPALTVTKLRASDSGAYTCKVSYAEGTSQTCTTDVHVAGTEELPLVYDSEGKTVQGKIGPYLEGSSLALTCEAGSDFDLSWHWNSTVLPGKRHIDMKAGVVRSQLNHRNISRGDLNADISCTASNSFGDDFKRTLKLDVWTKPTDIRIRPRPFNEDTAASVECEVLGSRPSPLVTWYLGDHGPLDASFTHDQTDDAVTTSVLTFTAQAGDSGKTLMCVAEHRIIDYKINTSFVVEVQYEPKVVLSLNASRPGAGEDVYLECEIQANPMATHVHWYLNSDPIAAFPLDVYQHTVTLRKTQVTPRDSGEYQCAALSSYGVGRSNVVNIYINGYVGIGKINTTTEEPPNSTESTASTTKQVGQLDKNPERLEKELDVAEPFFGDSDDNSVDVSRTPTTANSLGFALEGIRGTN